MCSSDLRNWGLEEFKDMTNGKFAAFIRECMEIILQEIGDRDM